MSEKPYLDDLLRLKPLVDQFGIDGVRWLLDRLEELQLDWDGSDENSLEKSN